jgi:multidrug efflux pump subunit AcrA (membrane-fusion protein)
MRIEIDVANPDMQLRPGMAGRATVHLRKGPADVLRVPLNVIRSLGPGPGGAGASSVYVVRDGKAHLVRVEFGFQGGTEIEVTAGLSPDDLVVTSPDKLSGTGVPVQVKHDPAFK